MRKRRRKFRDFERFGLSSHTEFALITAVREKPEFLFGSIAKQAPTTPNPRSKNTYPMNGKINISGINLDLTEALKTYVSEKASKLFEHNDRIIRANFELEYIPTKDPKNSFVAKASLEIPGPNIILSITSDDLYKSIDELMDKLIRQIRRAHRLEKEKRNHPQEIEIGEDIPKTK